MSFFQGFSQCLVPGPTCAVNWTAWVAIATVVLGWLAWRTSVAAKDIASRQEENAVRERDALGQIRGRLLLNEVTALQGYIARTQNHLHLADMNARGYVRNAEAMDKALSMATANPLPLSSAEVDNFHYFPDQIGHDLATLLGWVQTMNVCAREILDSGFDARNINGGMQYVGPTNEDVVRLSRFLHDFFGLSQTFATEFASYLGVKVKSVEPDNYLGPIA